MKTSNSLLLPTYFVSHGGGPWPYMKGAFSEGRNDVGQAYDKLEASLKDIPIQISLALTAQKLVNPKAILMISAHWEASSFSVMSSAHPQIEYDYYGFPDYTYQIKYPASGAPELSDRVKKLIEAAGFSSELDNKKGYDHGTYSVLYPMYPNANVPVVQLSLKKGLNPKEHIEVGKTLSPLRAEGTLIIGSGLSYHNLKKFNQNGHEASKKFDIWLNETLLNFSGPEREQRLINWEGAPSAREAHPREEHLLPLMVALGAAYVTPGVIGQSTSWPKASCIYHESAFFDYLTLSSFKFV
ncbi:MAG: class III extradiol ring-cleavage dioxygenase [Bdellovibrionales bacterium]